MAVYNRIIKHFLSCCIFIIIYSVSVSGTSKVLNHGQSCTFFGGNRLSAPESSLVNCSWYASNSCCKRTEVTSVFSGMYPLFRASKSCKNKINYMMCYFCSPEQSQWYMKKAHVCADFCRSLYEDCRESEYKGKKIGNEYESGEAFCDAQDFLIVEGKNGCFDFDPTPFGGSSTLHFNTYFKLSVIIALILKFSGT